MDQARLIDPVLHADAKRLVDIAGETEGPVRLLNAIDRSRLAVHLDSAALQPEDRSRHPTGAGVAGRRALRLCDRPKTDGCRGASQYHGTARQHSEALSKIVLA